VQDAGIRRPGFSVFHDVCFLLNNFCFHYVKVSEKLRLGQKLKKSSKKIQSLTHPPEIKGV
jgi:hypothetical protein